MPFGGSGVHGSITGLAHFVVNSEQEAFAVAKRLLSFLPANSKEMPPRYAENDPINRKTPEIRNIIPVDPQKSFDMKAVVRSFADNGDFMEVQENFAAEHDRWVRTTRRRNRRHSGKSA